MSKTIAFEVSDDLYSRFWDMKNELEPVAGEAIDHDTALAYLMDLHREHGTVTGIDRRHDDCPVCGATGGGESVLADGQRWCSETGCPVVSFYTGRRTFEELIAAANADRTGQEARPQA